MEQLNKKIKDIYNEEHAPLPDEFIWDEMKEGIFEKMQNQEEEPAPFFVIPNGVKFFLVTLFLIFAAASIYLLTNNFEKKPTNRSTKSKLKNPSKNKSTASNNIQKEEKVKSDHEDKSTLNQNNSVIKNTPILNSTPQKIVIDKEVDARQSIKNNKVVQSKAANTSAKTLVESSLNNKTKIESIRNASNKQKQNGKPVTINPKTIVQSIKTKPIDKKNDAYQTENKNELNNSTFKDEKFVSNRIVKENEVQIIQPLVTKTGNLVRHQIKEKIKQVKNISIIEEQAKSKVTINTLKLHAGLTYMKSLYKKTDEAQFKSETGFFAYYINASYNRTFANGFYLSLGTTYSRVKSKFELSDTITHNYLLQNAATKQFRSILTGKIIRTEYGDVEVLARSSRQVRHYNKFDAWSIPVIIGKHWNYKLLSWHIGLGSDVSIYNSFKGKTLRANEVITYSRSQSAPYQTGLRVATLAEAGIGLSINNHIEIIANLRHKMHIQNWSADELNVKPHVFLLGTGVKFKF